MAAAPHTGTRSADPGGEGGDGAEPCGVRGKLGPRTFRLGAPERGLCPSLESLCYAGSSDSMFSSLALTDWGILEAFHPTSSPYQHSWRTWQMPEKQEEPDRVRRLILCSADRAEPGSPAVHRCRCGHSVLLTLRSLSNNSAQTSPCLDFQAPPCRYSPRPAGEKQINNFGSSLWFSSFWHLPTQVLVAWAAVW